MKAKQIDRLLSRYRVMDGKKFGLKNHPSDDLDCGIIAPGDAEAALADGVARLAAQQVKLYAESQWSLLAVFQGMDASGKDGTIRHVLTGVNPQGVQATSFKAPGPETLAHDFLWRIHAAVPQRGRIGIFNRSHYEDVLVTRVHPELLDKAGLPAEVRGKKFWQHRLEDIAAFERYLARQGVVILKFYLHLSKDEQKRRFLARIDEAEKNWKFSTADLHERDFFDDYTDAFEKAIEATAAPHAPWYIVPADHKWFAHLVVVEALVDALARLNLREPSLPPEEQARLREARVKLEAE
ncbi:MAG TPA: polyphosphate kinase 2 family protein [Acetobacteraceae bacterium]|nr:polyphosphate kinase 2 family protein [Acetobacteraceae bacterium]